MCPLTVYLEYGSFGGGQTVNISTLQGCLPNPRTQVYMCLLETSNIYGPIKLEGECDNDHFWIRKAYVNNKMINSLEFNEFLKYSGYPTALVNAL